MNRAGVRSEPCDDLFELGLHSRQTNNGARLSQLTANCMQRPKSLYWLLTSVGVWILHRSRKVKILAPEPRVRSSWWSEREQDRVARGPSPAILGARLDR